MRRRDWMAAAVVLGVTVPALRVMRFGAARKVAAAAGALVVRSSAPLTVDDVRRAVTLAGRRVPGAATCLPQAMAAEVLLARVGRHPVLHVGVAAPGGVFGAHAWTEVDGEVVVGGDVSAFRRIL